MTKLRAVLATAATLVLGGLGIGIALNQAGLEHNMSVSQWCRAIERVTDAQNQDRFFLAVADGTSIPKAWPEGDDGRLLGDCSGGTCTIAPASAPDCAYEYPYDCGPLVNGWRICEVYAHRYIAKGWKLAAADSPDLRWYGSLGQVVQDCLEHFTGSQCLQLLQADKTCWLLDDGGVCRYGYLLGTTDPCPYARVAARLPCVVNRGAGSEMQDAQRIWTDAEMDEL